ncbi:MAG: hypothetical protein M1827_005889 [Pycnora praestabilis]|nr:MAG: hypothetical protein M1827_005889 [Pycnora praestabilis]
MSTAFSTLSAQPTNGYSSSANLASYLNSQEQPMDRGASDYSQSGLHSPYPAFNDPQSEGSPTDQASAAQYPPGPEVRSSNFSSSATPTSEYGINPSSARSGSFPEYLTRQPYPDGATRYHPPNNHSGSSGGMAQATSPSMPLADGHPNSHHGAQHIKSDPDVPIDPSIAASSPTYPPPGPYSPYPPQHDMSQGYPGHPGPPQMYGGRPDWGAQYGGHNHGLPGPYNAHNSPATTVSSASSAATAGPRPGQQSHPLSQVYSFVPIPGAQQHKRPRRRYEEIERMYKCGWNGCEKAYGTLNHLNAHVTMQSHGQKRTPEEFKEIRKEWKARKKEEDNQRKADEERQRAAAQANQVDGQNPADTAQAPQAANYPPGVRPQLPPIGYAPAQGGQVPGQYAAPSGAMDQMHQYGGNQMYSNYPPSPYGPGNQMYQQRHTPLQSKEETEADAELDPDAPPSNYQQ